MPLGGWQERPRTISTCACYRDVNNTTICSRSGLGPKESSCRIAKPSGEPGRLTGERGARPDNSASVKEGSCARTTETPRLDIFRNGRNGGRRAAGPRDRRLPVRV